MLDDLGASPTPTGSAPKPRGPTCVASHRPGLVRQGHRWRLIRGGDRQANSALWVIVITRMSSDPRTRAYVARRLEEGKPKADIIRILKRYVAREVYHHLPRD